MNRIWAALALVLAGAAGAGAETEVDAYGLGNHAPRPESWLKLDDDLSIRIRLLDGKGGLAERVAAGQTVQAEVTFYAQEGAADREVNLLCWVSFMDAWAVHSDALMTAKPCYRGRLSDATGRFVPLNFKLRFTPVATDPAGTSAVVLQVRDEVVGESVTLTPTYDWQGGHK